MRNHCDPIKIAKEYVLVLDVDGVLTDSTFYSSKEGKLLKRFGADDHDVLKEISKYIDSVNFITADHRGFEISRKRIEDEMKFSLSLVSNKPEERWQWIKDEFPNKKIIFIGDGIYDYYALEKADYSACPADSLDHVKNVADFVGKRTGANRFVAEACLHIMDVYLGVPREIDK
jgi:3-deoxy-D-manno-octulosonate 8-phosphate phosphatase (KDO 8-P phosphatase)